MNEKKYFSGWASCMHWIGVLCVIAAIPIALVSGLTKVALAVEVAATGLGLVLASAVLDWMDDLLDNVRRIRAHSAQSASEMETVNARLRRAEDDRHTEAIVRAAQQQKQSTGNPVQDFINGK